MGVSKILTGLANLAVMLASVVVIGVGVWLKTRTNGVECFEFLQWPLIVIGSVIFVVALVGFVGACCSVPVLLWVYLFVVFIAMLALLAFTVFAFVVTNPDAGETVSGQGFKDYRLGDYSTWLQRQVNDSSKWDTISSCLSQADICQSLPDKYTNESSLFAAKLSPTQAGCCLPPRDCGFVFFNATSFTIPASGPGNATDPDCALYRNNSTELCYGCDSCKAGLLQNVQNEWRLVSFINLAVLIAMFVVYSVGCCAYRSAKRDQYFGLAKIF